MDASLNLSPQWEVGGLTGYLIFRKGIQGISKGIQPLEKVFTTHASYRRFRPAELPRFSFCPPRDSILGPQERGRQTREGLTALSGGQHSHPFFLVFVSMEQQNLIFLYLLLFDSSLFSPELQNKKISFTRSSDNIQFWCFV